MEYDIDKLRDNYLSFSRYEDDCENFCIFIDEDQEEDDE